MWRIVILSTVLKKKLNLVILHFLNSLRSVYIVISLHFSNDKIFLDLLVFVNIAFQTWFFLKNRYGYGLEDKSLESSVHVSVSKISPYINILLSNKQCQFSHCRSFFLNSGELWIDKCKGKDRWKTDTVT